MKFFSWLQNKLNGIPGNKKPDPTSVNNHAPRQEPCIEEFSDWPHGLLAIGTFGNNDIKADAKNSSPHENQSHSNQHAPELTLEELRKFENELKSLLHNKEVGAVDTGNDNSGGVVLSRGKDVCAENSSKAINKKSLSFLLKKMLACRGGFEPQFNIRDQVPESRMEKILRAILHKKIYPQNPSPTLPTKKYLQNCNKQNSRSADEDGPNEKVDNGSKWVKTDSEYIVLEI